MNLRTWAVCGMLLGAAFLSGCAGGASGSGPDSTQADLPTQSDETPGGKRARVRVELATGYYQQGQTTVALDEIKQALQADPNHAPAFHLRGLIYMRLNEPALAESSFRRTLQLAPRDADAMHNLGWLLCDQARYPESLRWFDQALATPGYMGQSKTWMTKGLCQVRSGQRAEAEKSLLRSFELDAGNPVTLFHLSKLLLDTGRAPRAQFYARRLNNSEFANAESLWLGIRIERQLDSADAMGQLSDQLRRRFPDAPERALLDKGAFDE